MLDAIRNAYIQFLRCLKPLDGVAPLLLRLYLAPIFIQGGYNKFIAFDGTVEWFGNPDWGLGLPFPEFLVVLAAGSELVGGICLIPGIAVRLFSIPLMVTMVVAIFTVHLPNGWLAISDASSWLANERVMEAVDKKQRIVEILQQNGNYDWLTSSGPITILNNGVEFGATYLLMLLVLLFTGGGRYTSIDYWFRIRSEDN
ncbi:Putative oxidoreductase CatD [BD1-7 clade bacterium]|uniref:Oxidoreductase CatD n=1 Tax=BD1-7 clade bacterium TaxID=2029982 RepID=A0A5S9MQN2_9GAMM|nr:Putative oxidoreductase CatD [BD1-7 clade bacterium]CAA0081092.1 Putative oxidoreductase CatD [BD1-7 clade bacterium]CAA0084708.1 Putative oxidoreductase CatD [BD1-7 clade bacterium]